MSDSSSQSEEQPEPTNLPPNNFYQIHAQHLHIGERKNRNFGKGNSMP